MPVEVIKSRLAMIPQTSGVYQFLDEKEQILYVGKAKNLQKRVTSYTKKNQLSSRIARLVFLAKHIEIIQTESELEALLLEHNLIKKLQPRFNILLRDDKTFPQILLTDHKFPLIKKHRGVKSGKGLYFGPFASGLDVNRTIDVMRKIFRLRNCSDAEFKSRQKPCLEYQIKKCSAPCVGLVSRDDYEVDVRNAEKFLSGKSAELQKNLTAKMQLLSAAHDYENAAIIRDQIKSLDAIQAKQNINVDGFDDVDVITAVAASERVCVYINFFRGGQNFGGKAYFFELSSPGTRSSSSAITPTIAELELRVPGEILRNFLGQFYLDNAPPSLILLNVEPSEKKLLQEFLAKIAGRKVEIKIPKQGEKLRIIKDQEIIALQNLEQKISNHLSTKELHIELKKIFNLPKIPQKIEVYDNSHTSGTNAVGVLITAGLEGFVKSGYRKFNIGKEEFSNGKKDDTSMLSEVLTRRFSKLKKAEWPDFIIIDGGKPQLSAAWKVFCELKIEIPFICMAKGNNRNAGEEKFFAAQREKQDGSGEACEVASDLSRHSPAMYYLQRLRDEAHRFAIMTHRKKRGKAALE